MKPTFPPGPSTRTGLYLMGVLAAIKALALILLAQSVAVLLSGLAGGDTQGLASGSLQGLSGGGIDPEGRVFFEAVLGGAAGAVLRSLSAWGQAVAARRTVLGVKEELRTRLLRAALEPRGSRRVRSSGVDSDGGLAVLATRGLDALDNYYTQFLPALVNCAVVPLVLGARILWADWLSALVILLTVPLVPLFMVLIGRHTEERVQEAQAVLARLSGHIMELAKGLPVLVGLGRAGGQRKALEELSDEHRRRTMGTLRTAFMSSLALELIATISVAVVAVFIGVRLVAGEMPLEAGLLALLLAPDCYLPLRELGTAHHASDEGRVALAAAGEVLGDVGAGASQPSGWRPSPANYGDDGPGASPGGLAVEGLTVQYGGRRETAVGPLAFSAPGGTVTAIAGPSGSGKSTLLGVLAGMVRDDGAATQVEGAWSGFGAGDVALVPQHPTMVMDSVRDEVRLYLHGFPGAESDRDAAVERCLRRAGAAHLSDRHPAELSPGELRRVAVARGLARIEAGATLLLLDEPTAHLDEGAAQTVRDAIRSLQDRATVVLVAHDEQTRALADQIVDVTPVGAASAQLQAACDTPARGIETLPDGPLAAAESAVTPSAPGTGPAAEAPRLDAVRQCSAGSATAALLKLLAPVRWRFAGAAALGILAALFAAALSGLSGWLIIRASEQPPILYLLGAIVGVRFFGIGRAVLRYCERLALHDAVFASVSRLRGALWAALSRRALSLRRLLQGGSVLGSVVDDVDTVRDLLPRVVLPPLTAAAVVAACIVSTAMLLPAALPAALASAAASLLLAPILSLTGDRMSARAEQRHRVQVLRGVSAALDARDELLANGVAGPVLSAIQEDDRAATASSQRSAWADGLGHAVTALACSVSAIGCTVLAMPAVAEGAAAATVAVVVLLQLAQIEPCTAATSAVRQFPALREVLGRVVASGALEPAAQEGGPAGPGLIPVPDRTDGRAGVRITGLEAGWTAGRPVFSGISAVAEPGTWLAVRGPSGAGKSTLMAVLLGFLPPRAGRVEVTGASAWCPQEAHLFDSTIRGNLMLGLPSDHGLGTEESARRMTGALAAAGLGPLVERLDDGLDARIGPGGAFLSGGERQRLAVARTLLTGADVILLDEPTAHLDADTGSALLSDLRLGLAHKTVIMVTHNPADLAAGDAELILGTNRPHHEGGGPRHAGNTVKIPAQ